LGGDPRCVPRQIEVADINPQPLKPSNLSRPQHTVGICPGAAAVPLHQQEVCPSLLGVYPKRQHAFASAKLNKRPPPTVSRRDSGACHVAEQAFLAHVAEDGRLLQQVLLRYGIVCCRTALRRKLQQGVRPAAAAAQGQRIATAGAAAVDQRDVLRVRGLHSPAQRPHAVLHRRFRAAAAAAAAGVGGARVGARGPAGESLLGLTLLHGVAARSVVPHPIAPH
jgi:hypothetical protein